MNYKKDYLYFAKCRKCIMDLVNDFYDENKIVRPRPDFVDYYAILYKRKDGSYINIDDTETILRKVTEYDNIEETYDCDLILEIEPLNNYLNVERKRLNTSDCELVESTIVKTKKLRPIIYGYKK